MPSQEVACPAHGCSYIALPSAQPCFSQPRPTHAPWGPAGSLGFCRRCQWGVLVLSGTPGCAAPSSLAPFGWAMWPGGRDGGRVGKEGLYCKHAEQLSVNAWPCLPAAEDEVRWGEGPQSHVPGTQQLAGVPPTTPPGSPD